jgi:PAS domain S-box-containing protein
MKVHSAFLRRIFIFVGIISVAIVSFFYLSIFNSFWFFLAFFIGTWLYFELILKKQVQNFDKILEKIKKDELSREKNLAINLEQKEQKLQNILDQSADFICTSNLQGQFVTVNATSEKIFGYKPAELEGKFYLEFIHPDDLQITVDTIQGVILGKDITNFSNRFKCKLGHFVPIIWSARWNKEEQVLYGVARDASEIYKAQQEIQEYNYKITHILEGINEGFYTCNKDWIVEYWNSAAEKLTGVQKEKIVGQALWNIFTDTSNDIYEKYQHSITTATPAFVETFSESIGKWFSISMYPLFDGISVFFRDISERKHRESLYLLENEVLELYTTKKASLEEMITFLLDGIQKIHPKMLCSVLKVEDGKLYNWASPHLPREYNQAIEALSIQAGAGSCGTAAYLKKKIIVSDITQDVLWKNYKELAARHNLQSCWSYPIMDKNKNVLGTFGIYHHSVRFPKLEEENTIEKVRSILINIIENKIAENALLLSNERYDIVSKATSNAIWDWNLAQDTSLWGDGFYKLFGYHLPKNMTAFEAWELNIHPDDSLKVTENLENTLNDSEKFKWEAEYRYKKANNEYATVLDRGYIIRNPEGKAIRMIGAVQDITKIKEEEHRLKLFESIVINATDMIIVTNALDSAKIVYVNDAFTRITGYTREEVLGKNSKMFQGEKSDKKVLETLSQCLEKWEFCQAELVNYKKNGEEFWVNFTVIPIANEKGWFTHWITIQRDITTQKENEQRLKSLSEQNQKRAEELAISNLELEQFAYIASHDLQEPLRMVTSFLTQLEKKYKDQLDDKAKQYIYFAVDGAVRMRKIILDLLEYSRLGKKGYQVEKIAVDKLLEDVVNLNQTSIKEQKAKVIWENMPIVNANRTSLQQVFQNLIANALKYKQNGVQTVIKIDAIQTNTHWRFSVSDNGIGIEPKFFQKIFIIFQRLHNKDEYSGTGIGLAICKKIIENYNGKIWVESVAGQGSTFYFTISK